MDYYDYFTNLFGGGFPLETENDTNESLVEFSYSDLFAGILTTGQPSNALPDTFSVNATKAPVAVGTGSFVIMDILRLIVCAIGIIGNLLVIFVILILAEYKKAITHWYVLQLAIADTLFLLCLPFRVIEDTRGHWPFSVAFCKTKETILFLNYYSSILFLMVMSADRYIAICHGFSDRLQKLRTPFASAIITVAVWTVALLLCVPIMMYSGVYGREPNCKCQYEFPDRVDPRAKCIAEHIYPGQPSFDMCIRLHESRMNEATCQPFVEDTVGVGFVGLNSLGALAENFRNQTVIYADCSFRDQKVFVGLVIFNFVGMFVIPFVVLTICYSLIIVKLRSVRMPSDNNASDSGASRSHSEDGRNRALSAASIKENKKRTRVTVMCAFLVIVFFVCWMPYHVVNLARMRGIPGEIGYCSTVIHVVTLIAYINSAINPYLYNFIGTKFFTRLRTAAHFLRNSCKKRIPTEGIGRRNTGGSTGINGTAMTKMNRKSESRVATGFSNAGITDENKKIEGVEKGKTLVLSEK